VVCVKNSSVAVVVRCFKAGLCFAGLGLAGLGFVTLLGSMGLVACSAPPSRQPTQIRGSDCDDAYRPAICPGDVDCAYDERTGCEICTCNSDEHKIDALPTRENLR
jgi:hypothetical protein